MSKMLNDAEQTTTKTIQVKPIEQFMKRDTKRSDTQTTEQLNLQMNSLKEQIKQLEERIASLKEHKQQVIKETEIEIAALKNAWGEEKQTYIAAAHEEGYQAGFHQGEKTSLDEYKHLISEANKTIQLAQEDYNKTIKESEPTIIELAVHVAEKIVHKQLDIDPDVIKRIVIDVIDGLTEQAEIKISVSSKDYEPILQQKKDFENLLPQSSNLIINIDPEIEEGMCKIEYPSGKTDASIQTQLQLIENELLNIVTEKNK